MNGAPFGSANFFRRRRMTEQPCPKKQGGHDYAACFFSPVFVGRFCLVTGDFCGASYVWDKVSRAVLRSIFITIGSHIHAGRWLKVPDADVTPCRNLGSLPFFATFCSIDLFPWRNGFSETFFSRRLFRVDLFDFTAV